MSLAPASNRGAFLKARLAVNGIQCAARSLGTLTAAGSGLLSSIGASLSFRISRIFWLWRRSPKAISFGAKRERHDRRYLWSVGWFEGAQGDIKGIDEPFRIVGYFDLAMQLLAERLDQPGSEALPGWRLYRRPTFFGPAQMQPLLVRIDGPGD